jgi:hypothetical protein
MNLLIRDLTPQQINDMLYGSVRIPTEAEVRTLQRRDAYLDALQASLEARYPGPENMDRRAEALGQRVTRNGTRTVLEAFAKVAGHKPVRHRGKLNRRWRKANKMAARAQERFYAL